MFINPIVWLILAYCEHDSSKTRLRNEVVAVRLDLGVRATMH
jgi:hypothetical protein